MFRTVAEHHFFAVVPGISKGAASALRHTTLFARSCVMPVRRLAFVAATLPLWRRGYERQENGAGISSVQREIHGLFS